MRKKVQMLTRQFNFCNSLFRIWLVKRLRFQNISSNNTQATERKTHHPLCINLHTWQWFPARVPLCPEELELWFHRLLRPLETKDCDHQLLFHDPTPNQWNPRG